MKEKKGLRAKTKVIIAIVAVLLLGLGAAGAWIGLRGGSESADGEPEVADEIRLLAAGWPSALNVEANDEPVFPDDPNRTNNAFNVQDFGEQGNNGWRYRSGNSKRPLRAKLLTGYDGEKYYQTGANGLEIKKNFIHTSEAAAPILEWVVAENGKINVSVTYVKSVNGDANPSYPDGVQLMIYKGDELLKFENVDISTTEEVLAEIKIEQLEVTEDESLYFVVDPKSNNAYDGGSLYIYINDREPEVPEQPEGSRKDNNANSMEDFGEQGSNGWYYMYGTAPADAALVSHEMEGEYINATSPNLSISQGFIHPAINHNAVLGWAPAVNGNVDLRIRYTKFEQNDGNPDFPDGVKIKAYKNNELLYEEHVDAPDEGENKLRYRVPKLAVTTSDRLYFMVDAEGNSSYDGGAFDVTIIDINGATDESDISVETSETRQNIANVKDDFGKQGSNGWIFQWGYWDDPFNAYNAEPYDQGQDRYFYDSYLEIKRDYVNPGTHDRSAIIKWAVAQTGTVSVRASYTKMKNEDANPAWPDGTRVSVYLDGTLLTQQTFAPEVDQEVTKRLDVSSLSVRRGQYITMVINGLDNTAYDGGKYEFAITTLSGLVGRTERDISPYYDGERENFASTKDDFGAQGYNGWYYQFGYNHDPFFAVNVEKCENNEKYYTSDGVEIKKDYIMPGNKGKSANVKWVAAKDGKINIDLTYTKLLNQDANPSWPDGVTVYLMKNGQVLRKEYFAPRTDKEITKDLSISNVSVKKGDCITMIVDPGENNAYDGGKYMFVIEDADKTPKITNGNHDNDTVLGDLDSTKQGTDGWWFLEGTAPGNAKVLTKQTPDKAGYNSRRTEGLEMKKDFVHTGDTLDPIYLWVVGKDGKIDVSGSYVKFGQEDSNPSWPDGVTVKIFLNSKNLYSKKVKVLRGDGNDNTISFSFDGLSVKKGDRLYFQICADSNWAWDAGRLSVVIEPTNETKVKPGKDNNTALGDLDKVQQGEDGWWFFEGTSPKDAKLLTKQTEDKTGYVSKKSAGLEMKKDYVHTGATLDPIYQWIVAKNGNIDVAGSYMKFGQEDQNPSYPDGVTLKIYHNNKKIFDKKVKVLKGDGNNNVVSFTFDKLAVKKNDKLSFQICKDGNNAWDAGRLSVAIEETAEIDRKPGDDNNTVLGSLTDVEQGNDGWWFLEGTKLDNVKLLTKLSDDKSSYVSVKDPGLEMKKDYVHPGATNHAFYQWVVKDDGKLDVKGSYVKFGHNDENPDYPDGVVFIISQNDKQLLKKTVKALQGDGKDNVVDFKFVDLDVKAGDIFSFEIAPGSNNAWDAGRLSVIIGKEEQDAPGDDNNTVLKDNFGEQGSDGWYYGMCDWDSQNFVKLTYDEANKRYYNNGKPELKADFVEPGNGKNAAYKWVVANDGTIVVKGKYTKFANSDDPSADGTCVRIFLNGGEKKWIGSQSMGNFDADRSEEFEATYEVKAGDVLIFAVNPEGNDSYDGGRLEVTISDKEEGPDDPEPAEEDKPGDDNNTVLKDNFGAQGSDGWYYGMCDWDSQNFTRLAYDEENKRYYNNGKPELKADFVEPGNGKNAAYKWVVAKDGTIVVKGKYTKFANNEDPSADGTCVRIFINGGEKKWMGSQTMGNFAEERSEAFEEEYEVKAGDILIFAVNPEGNDSYDGGRLEVTISEKAASDQPDDPQPGGDETPDPDRTNKTSLKDSFGEQGNDGWNYGMCDWDSKNFQKLNYDAENKRYYNNGKPELKADFVEPGNGRNAAYQWEVAKDGKIKVTGKYTKFANNEDPSADGTCVRIFINGAEKKWMGNQTMGNFSEERSESFDEEYEVKAGDIITFAVNPEGNDSYDGGRLEVTISEVETVLEGSAVTADKAPEMAAADPAAAKKAAAPADSLKALLGKLGEKKAETPKEDAKKDEKAKEEPKKEDPKAADDKDAAKTGDAAEAPKPAEDKEAPKTGDAAEAPKEAEVKAEEPKGEESVTDPKAEEEKEKKPEDKKEEKDAEPAKTEPKAEEKKEEPKPAEEKENPKEDPKEAALDAETEEPVEKSEKEG